MPHRNQLATPKVKDIQRSLDITRPFMDDIGAFVRVVFGNWRTAGRILEEDVGS